ncbi:hypothetical protein M569_14623, partial [Genlisea aurea]
MFSDEEFYGGCVFSLFFLSLPTAVSLLFISAPYGRHRRGGWGPAVSPPVAWCVMESPTIWLTLLLFPHGKNRRNPRAMILISPYLLHYLHRAVVYPLRLLRKTPGAKEASGFPASVAAMAFGFNLLNAYLQSRWVSEYADLGESFWLRFCGGGAVFVAGAAVNVWSDYRLLDLKESGGGGGGGYRVPRGGIFEWISCPNYFGEMVEWLGWALMTWSWAGLGFFIYTVANLGPRAVAHHNWYLEKFGEDYPKSRRPFIPSI